MNVPGRISLVATLATVVLSAALPASAAQARPAHTGAKSTASGYDVSYPQCSSTLPATQAFGIVGVNGGKATTTNNCLGSELAWASASPGTAAQPAVQLYVNTADPGQVIDQVTDWPTSGGNATYGTCDGSDSPACSWEYGRERAENDVVIFQSAVSGSIDPDPGHYVWWLDVETGNTWETGSDTALANNRAALEGMVYAFATAHGGTVGVYSTNSQWAAVAGTVPASTPLYPLDSWMAGARTTKGAQSNCGNPPLSPGGRVVLSQYVSSGLDQDLSCG